MASLSQNSQRIAVLGEALIDLFPDGDVIGGAPYNVARNLALLGGDPVMVTRIGSDPRGDTIAAEFVRFGMDPRGLQRDAVRPTGTVKVHMRGTQHRFEIVADQSWDHLDPVLAVDTVRRVAPSIVYFGTLAQRSSGSHAAIQAALAATPALRFLDLNLRDGPDNRQLSESSLTCADRVKVNDDELDLLLDWFGAPGARALPWGEAAHRAAVQDLARRFDLQRLCITRGALGWACFDAIDGHWWEGTSRPVALRDTVGAGDAFASVLLLGEVNRWPLPATLQRASDFASAVCGIKGAVDPQSGIYEAARAAWA